MSDNIYVYRVQPMPGQKPKFVGDPSVKYQVRRVNQSLPAHQKGRTEVIRTNLEYEAAVALVARYNEMETRSQVIRDEEAARKEQSSA